MLALTAHRICSGDQRKYHVGVASGVDLAVLWPPNHLETTMHRPPTRLLYWWAHGVPTVFFPYKSYEEVAEAAGYVLTTASAGQLKLGHDTFEGIEKAVTMLAADPTGDVVIAYGSAGYKGRGSAGVW